MGPTEARFRRWMADHICPELKRERIAVEEWRLANVEAARLLFHHVWSEAHNSPDYQKQHWKDFSQSLERLGLEF
jgi:hypothetical protein